MEILMIIPACAETSKLNLATERLLAQATCYLWCVTTRGEIEQPV